MSTIACRPPATPAAGSTRSFLVSRWSRIPGLVALLLGVPAVQASEVDDHHRVPCEQLTRLRFEGNTTVTAATEVTSRT